MTRHLLLRLEAPLMAFGTVAIDARRPSQRWPATSMLTGLLANALGWDRRQSGALDRLQARLRWVVRIDRPGDALVDFQTAALEGDDRGWTTWGRPEGRKGGADTFQSPHIRYREYRADAAVAVALHLDPADEAPTVDDLAQAIRTPRRPLFIGRKSCIPAGSILIGVLDDGDAWAALDSIAPADGAAARPTCYAHADAPVRTSNAVEHRTGDRRQFSIDTHAGIHVVREYPGEVAGEAP